MDQSCCENADWFIADKVVEVLTKDLFTLQERELDGYQFDRNFFKEISYIKSDDGSDQNALDGGSMVVFRLVNGDKEKFLHLYNCHNGFYEHGFEVKINGSVVRKGSL